MAGLDKALRPAVDEAYEQLIHGELRTAVRIMAIKTLYRLGVSADRLARAYPPAR